jgi:hypothetical protein
MKWIWKLETDLPPEADEVPSSALARALTPPRSRTGRQVVWARALWRRFKDNQVAAELRHGESVFELEGTIDHVDRDARGRIRVHFQVDRYETLRMLLPEAAREEARVLRPGDLVRCLGRVAEVDCGVVELEAVEAA